MLKVKLNSATKLVDSKGNLNVKIWEDVKIY